MSRQQTAKRAAQLLVEKGVGFKIPTREQRRALLVAFAKLNKVLYGKAFDIVRLGREFDLDDPDEIVRNIKQLTIYEVKSTSKKTVGEDFSGYFFALTTAELLVAQSLEDQYKFVFVNTITGEHIELSKQEVFAKAKKIYPTWSIQF